METALKLAFYLEADALVKSACSSVAHGHIQSDRRLNLGEDVAYQGCRHTFATKIRMYEQPGDEAAAISSKADNAVSIFHYDDS